MSALPPKLEEAPKLDPTGRLELVCSLDGRGESHLSRQMFSAPFHLSKPHRHAGVLVVNLVSTSPGLLAGDHLRTQVTVDSGAQLLLTMPGASRVHRMARGHAELRQEFTVQRGGWLEVLPELFIPHRGARYRQQTAVRVEQGGAALLFESVAPGRTASGEIFVYDELHWATDIFYRDRLVARERYTLHPGSASSASLRQVYPEAYYASCYAIGLDFLRPELLRCILRLQTPTVWIGCGPIKSGGVVIKIVASGSIVLREALHLLRSLLYGGANRAVPSLRRVSPIG